MALALAVFPLGCGDSSLYENEPSLGEVFSQTDMVLPAAAYPYPCSDILTFGVIINGYVNRHECSVRSCDDLAILADASDSVRVKHNLKCLMVNKRMKSNSFLFPLFRKSALQREEEGSLGLLL